MVRPDFETGPGTSIISLVWIMPKPLWGTRKTVIIYSGFFVLKLLIGMYERGVYGILLVKKRRYYPLGIFEDQINVGFFLIR